MSAPPETVASQAVITVKRNCSITPRAVMILLAITTAISFSIGAGFAWVGLWVVLPFAAIEMAFLATAFYVNGRHAADYERFTMDGAELVVERRDAARVLVDRFPASWVRLTLDETKRDARLALALQGRELEIGRHLNASGRALLAQSLRQWLSGSAAYRIQS